MAKWTLCAPGDQQRCATPRLILKFDDAEMGDMLFDDEDEAHHRWEALCGPSGNWNGYLFEIAARKAAPAHGTTPAAVESES